MEKKSRPLSETLIVVLTLIPCLMIRGATFAYCWAWFLRPIFTTLPPIGWRGAMVIVFTTNVFKLHYNAKDLKDETTGSIVVSMFFTEIVLLGVAFGWHLVLGSVLL